MLAIDEIMPHLPSSFHLSYVTYYGHTLAADQQDCIDTTLDNVIHLKDVYKLLQPRQGGIFTCNKHNVAIYCCGGGHGGHGSQFEYLIFDSLPACTYELNQDDLVDCLHEIFGKIVEFNFFLLQTNRPQNAQDEEEHVE